MSDKEIKNKDIDVDSEETIVRIPKSKLDSILERIDTLEKQNGVQEVKAIDRNTARMRKFEDKWVVGFSGKNWTEYNEKEKKEEMFATLLMYDGKKTDKKKVNYAEFLDKSEVFTVEIKEMKTVFKKEDLGEVAVKERQDYRMVETGDYVDMVINTPISTATIILPEIGEYSCDVNSLNI